MPRVRDDIERLGARGLHLGGLRRRPSRTRSATVMPFDGYCCHTVDPGTILFTGSVNRNVGCSGSWLAHHEYVVEDVNKWSFLAHSGRIAGATSIDTHGDLSRSTRHRSHEAYGFGDELRVSFVVDGIYWGAAAFLRQADEPWFTEAEVRTLVALAPVIGAGLRRSLLAPPGSSCARRARSTTARASSSSTQTASRSRSRAPRSAGSASWSRTRRRASRPSRRPCRRSRPAPATIAPGTDPLELAARARVRTRSGAWLLLYGTRLERRTPTDGPP